MIKRVKEAKWGFILCFLVLIICSVLYLINPFTFWADDFQSYFLPGFYDIGRSLCQGDFPLLSPYSWLGGNFIGEYQYAVFNPFELTCYLLIYLLKLPLSMLAGILVALHLMVMALGVFFLIRQRGLNPRIAVFAGLIFAFNGWGFCWGARNWYIAMSSVMWLPWLWWSLEGISTSQNRRIKIIVSSLFVFFLISSGFPYGILMGLAITVWVYVENLRLRQEPKSIFPFVLSWLLGMGLSAPSWMSILEYASFTTRNISNLGIQEYGKWTVPFNALLGMINPDFPSIWRVFSGQFDTRTSIELFNGVLPIIFIGAALFLGKQSYLRKQKSQLIFAFLVLLLSSLPGFLGFRFSFKWLALFHLVVSIIAAESLDYMLRTKEGIDFVKNKLILYIFFCVTVAWALGRYCSYCNIGLDLYNESNLFWYLLIFSGYGLFLKRSTENQNRSITLIVISFIFILVYANFDMKSSYPQWNFTDSLVTKEPWKENIQYISFYLDQDIYTASGRFEKEFGDYLKPANLGMFSGVRCIQGYSPQAHFGLTKIFSFKWFGQIGDLSTAERILKYESGPDGLLNLMGIDGVVLSRSFSKYVPILKQNGWNVVDASSLNQSYDFAIIMERKNVAALRLRSINRATFLNNPRVILRLINNNKSENVPVLIYEDNVVSKVTNVEYANAKVELIKDGRNKTVFRVTNNAPDKSALILVSRPWYPGFKAVMNRKKLTVKIVDMIMPAVLVPPGESGIVNLYFRPFSLTLGISISIISLILMYLIYKRNLGKGWINW